MILRDIMCIILMEFCVFFFLARRFEAMSFWIASVEESHRFGSALLPSTNMWSPGGLVEETVSPFRVNRNAFNKNSPWKKHLKNFNMVVFRCFLIDGSFWNPEILPL